jgi:hypothetical protein
VDAGVNTVTKADVVRQLVQFAFDRQLVDVVPAIVMKRGSIV